MPKSKAKNHVRRKPLNRWTLLILAILLSGSGLVRLGGLGAAFADDVSAMLLGTSAAPTEVQTCSTEADIEIVLTALREREDDLAKKEEALEARVDALAVADEQISGKLEALVTAEQKLAATMSIAQTAASDDLTRLTALYENMKPKQAIPLFEAMDPDFAAGFMSRMKPAIGAQIMAGLSPQTAYAISVVLAGRHSDVPTN